MESKVNYALVGFFVLLLGAMGIIIPLWLSSGLDKQKYTTYSVYMNESVDGLSDSALVTYNGVTVGNVKAIRLNPKNTEQVQLLLDIKSDTPITTNTTATLQSQGITGIAYIGLKGGTLQNAKLLMPLEGEKYPRIKAMPSIRVRLDTALTTLMNNLNTLNKQLDTLLSPSNTKAFSQILININKMTEDLSKHGENIDKSLQSLSVILQQLSKASQNFPDISNQLQSTLTNVQALTQEMKQNPSILIRGKAVSNLGPGEK